MEDIADITDGRSFKAISIALILSAPPTLDYDDNPDEVESWERDGEAKPQNKTTDLRECAANLARNRPVPFLQFFLDGSRHVYHVMIYHMILVFSLSLLRKLLLCRENIFCNMISSISPNDRCYSC